MKRWSLATRTGLAAAAAAAIALGAFAIFFRGYIQTVLFERVDRQLEARAGSAPILAAVGDRLAVSELGAVVQGARVVFTGGPGSDGQDSDGTDSGATGGELRVGALPTGDLPPVTTAGWSTARADGEDWRLYTVIVNDVPKVGDRALVQLAAPLGDVDEQVASQRRRSLVIGTLGIGASGGLGYLFGSVAAAPLRRLRRDASRVGAGPVDEWRVAEEYGVAEVDDVAAVLNAGLDRIADETSRREAALESARAFAASAAHELRTPLTGAVTNLDVARSESAQPVDRSAAILDARHQLDRMAATLGALRDLADADLAGSAWFSEFDLADLVAVVVGEQGRRSPDVRFDLDAPDELIVSGWSDGIRLACSNMLRNAVIHGRPDPGGEPRISIRVSPRPDSTVIEVSDNGQGIPVGDRAKVLARFVRGSSECHGSGLGLALVNQVAVVHGGRVEIDESAAGGASVALVLSTRSGGP